MRTGWDEEGGGADDGKQGCLPGNGKSRDRPSFCNWSYRHS